LFVDKCDAVKSARSLSRTIDSLIGREQERLSEYYDSMSYSRSGLHNQVRGLQSKGGTNYQTMDNSKLLMKSTLRVGEDYEAVAQNFNSLDFTN